MESDEAKRGFTVYLEGHEGHQGNVLLHAFLGKVHKLAIVLNKLERAYIDSGTRQTDFEIIDADKKNPTTLTLKPIPKVKAYDPTPAFKWSIEQINTVAKGGEPDARVRGDVADDLVKLATKESEYGYKAFWINGYAEAVRFDEDFLINALRFSKKRNTQEADTVWRTGVAHGSVIGELKYIDDLEGDRKFIILPPTGAESILCTFPENTHENMRQFLFKTVKVTGNLHYVKTSPFPQKVDADDNGIEVYPARTAKRKLSEMRGMFAGRDKNNINWDDFLGV